MMLLQSNEPVPAGYDCDSRPLSLPVPVEVYWQVVNTGSEAESEPGGLRGEIFEAKAKRRSFKKSGRELGVDEVQGLP